MRRTYRDILIGERKDVRLIYLKGTYALIAERLSSRKGHFMPPALLESQFRTLQEPGPDENPITIEIAGAPEKIVEAIMEHLK
jgi:carbohydrate kinase (thermoresistant glucokinase family)